MGGGKEGGIDMGGFGKLFVAGTGKPGLNAGQNSGDCGFALCFVLGLVLSFVLGLGP